MRYSPTKDVIKEKIHSLLFEREVTLEYVGNIACKVLGINTADIQSMDGPLKNEYSIFKNDNNHLKLLFSIKFQEKRYVISSTKKKKEMYILK